MFLSANQCRKDHGTLVAGAAPVAAGIRATHAVLAIRFDGIEVKDMKVTAQEPTVRKLQSREALRRRCRNVGETMKAAASAGAGGAAEVAATQATPALPATRAPMAPEEPARAAVDDARA